GSVEYWPDPQRAVAEAYRVLRPGGRALLAGPLLRTHPIARRLSDAWMLFPAEDEYVAWFERAGFERIERVHVAPAWWDERWDPYAVAIAGVKPRAGEPSLRLDPPSADSESDAITPARMARFAAGSLAGAAFIPVALWFSLRARLRRLRG
ncbi:MAG TPA: methyltransferase domain-containing protein, partial [Solirubrobacteraceae bacterium]|nr:methyltransferase domain-containing protein [Solirubrobacteraceae bacterium]